MSDKKSKAELFQMLAEAVRNTQLQPLHASSRLGDLGARPLLAVKTVADVGDPSGQRGHIINEGEKVERPPRAKLGFVRTWPVT